MYDSNSEHHQNPLYLFLQHGWTALMCAAYEGHTEVVGELLSSEAELDTQDEVMDLTYFVLIH